MALSAIGVGGYFLLSRYYVLPWQKYLNISADVGGTTDPAPGRYKKRINENVTITAIPAPNYTVGTWIVDGANFGHTDTISVTMDTDHSVIVTFWFHGIPPPTEPVKIVSEGPATVIQNLGVWDTNHIARIWPFKDDWSWVGWSSITMKFQVQDSAQKGVPNIPVAVWTDPKDISRYAGTTLINGNFHGIGNPLTFTTDSDGVVTVPLAYAYGLSDAYDQLCKDAWIAATVFCPPDPIPITKNVYDKYDICNPCAALPCSIYSRGGDCQTMVAGCEKMGTFAINRVYASVVGTAYSTSDLAYCGFHIKWVDKPQADLTEWHINGDVEPIPKNQWVTVTLTLLNTGGSGIIGAGLCYDDGPTDTISIRPYGGQAKNLPKNSCQLYYNPDPIAKNASTVVTLEVYFPSAGTYKIKYAAGHSEVDSWMIDEEHNVDLTVA